MAQDHEITKERSYFVAKANELVTRSRYSLSLQQQKTLLFLISKIKPYDQQNQMYQISIKDFCKVCGYAEDSGYYYQEIKRDIKELATVGVWIETRPGHEELFRWIDRAEINRYDGVLSVSFHSTIAPYLFELRERYTQYSLFNVLGMKSKYSIRLYELLFTLRYQKVITLQIQELKVRLDASGYDKYSHFSSRVIEPAVNEINEYTDIEVEYKPIRVGRSYVSIEFTVKTKDINGVYDSMKHTDAELDRHESDK